VANSSDDNGIRMITAINQAVISATDVDAALCALPAVLGVELDWAYAELWTWDSEKNVLTLRTTWQQAESENIALRSSEQCDKLTIPPVSVNVSGRQIDGERLDDLVLSILAEVGVSPSSLKLEFTESGNIGNTEAISKMMFRLREAGVTFAIDDFGIEHSALSLLSRFSIDTIKIDRFFVSQTTVDSAHTALVQAIISMSHAMRKGVVAEGIESHDEPTILRAFRCDSLQGYLFAKPVPHGEMAKFLRMGTIAPTH